MVVSRGVEPRVVVGVSYAEPMLGGSETRRAWPLLLQPNYKSDNRSGLYGRRMPNATGDRAPTSNYRVREIRFTVAREAGAPPRLVLDQPTLVAQLARQLIADDAKEHFWIALLDSKNQVVAWHHMSTGTLTATLVTPREIFGPVLA